MEEKRNWKITLADGTIIEGLELNGNNFVSKTKVTTEMFIGKLAKVSIDGPENVDDAGLRGEHGPMELLQIAQYDGDWYIALRDIPAGELERRRIMGDIEYIAMMADINLEEVM